VCVDPLIVVVDVSVDVPTFPGLEEGPGHGPDGGKLCYFIFVPGPAFLWLGAYQICRRGIYDFWWGVAVIFEISEYGIL